MVGEDSLKALSPILGAFPRKVTAVRLVYSLKAIVLMLALRGPHALIHFALDHKAELLRLPT